MNKRMLRGYLLTIGSFIALVLPFFILFYWKKDEWVTVEEDVTSISIGVMLGLVYAVFVLKGAFKTVSPKVATLISMGITLAIVWFLQEIMQDLFWVVLSITVGYILFIVVSAIGAKDLSYYKAYKDEKARVVARREVEDEIVGV